MVNAVSEIENKNFIKGYMVLYYQITENRYYRGMGQIVAPCNTCVSMGHWCGKCSKYCILINNK